MNSALSIMIGGISMATAIGMSTIGAHYLPTVLVKQDDSIKQYRTRVWESANRQHYFSSFGMILAPIVKTTLLGAGPHRLFSPFAFLAGSALFSATIYNFALTGQSNFKFLAPFGGTLNMIGWLLVAFGK